MNLLDVYMPLFTYAINIISFENNYTTMSCSESEVTGRPSPNDVREQLLDLHNRITKQAKEKSFPCQDISSATLATLICLDEIILCSNSHLADVWQNYLLQNELPVKGLGGIVFYENLADIDINNHSLRILYIFCLFLGFKGKYIVAGEVSLGYIIDDEISKLPPIYQDSIRLNENNLWNFQVASFSVVENKGPLLLLIFCVSIALVLIMSNFLLIN